MPKKIVRCTINGVKREYFIDVRLSLLEMLREEAGLDSVKHGCNVGECGACTVLIDGLTYNACIYLAVWAEGKTIITLEGLDKTGAIRYSASFYERRCCSMCFCTRALSSRQFRLLQKNLSPVKRFADK